MKRILLLIIFSISVIYAELSPRVYLLTSLFESSDCVVSARVADVNSTENEYVMSLKVLNNLGGNISQENIDIITEKHKGFYIPDRVYLVKNKEYILFLKEVNGKWKIVNNVAGVMDINVEDDIVILASTINKDKNSLKELFNRVKSDQIRLRLLNEIDGYISDSDSRFVDELFNTNKRVYQIHSLYMARKTKCKKMKNTITNILQNSSDRDMIFYSINSLKSYKNKNDLVLITPFLFHSEQGIRRAAIEACGRISPKECLEDLKSAYRKEEDFGNRVAIIEAISLLKPKKTANETIEYFLKFESNSTVISTANHTLENLAKQ